MVHSKATELKEYDEKICKAQEKLQELTKIRQTVTSKFGDKHKTLSELISNIEDKAQRRELELKRETIRGFVYKITIINKVINSLIEHSLKMIDGSIGAIAKATVATQTKGDYYNQTGQKQQQEIQTLSAIIREA